MLNGLYYDDETGAEQYFADCEKANNYFETLKICGNCRFGQASTVLPPFTFDDSGRITFENVDCRFNAPTHQGFPRVRGDAWCRKFERKR